MSGRTPVKIGKYVYTWNNGHWLRNPPANPPRTYFERDGSFYPFPLEGPKGPTYSSSSSREPNPYDPRYEKYAVKATTPKKIRGVTSSGEESDVEYEYSEPKKRKPVTSSLVVPKKSKSVQTTSSRMAHVGVYDRVSSEGTPFKTYRYFRSADDTTGKPINLAKAVGYKEQGVPFVSVRSKSKGKKPGVGAYAGPPGSRERIRLESTKDIIDYDESLTRRSTKSGRPDASLIPTSHIKYVAREYNISPADVSGIIRDMDNLAIRELRARKSEEPYERYGVKKSANPTYISKKEKARLLAILRE